MKPDDRIYRQVMEDIAEYTGKDSCHSPRFEAYPYPQRIARLSDLVKGHTLREGGKIKRYLALQKEVFELAPEQIRKSDKAIYGIIEWLDQQMETVRPVTCESEPLVLFMLVFGEAFLTRMLGVNFPSLMAKGNLPALCKERRVIVYLVTDEPSKQIIEAARITQRMKDMGILFDYAILSPEVMARLNEDTTYWLLGASASLALHYAKALRAAFHHSYPDAVYSERFFEEALRLAGSHPSILGQAMRADETLLLPLLEPYRNDGALSVPTPDLVALHLNAVHQVFWPLLVNHRAESWQYPLSHVLAWEGEQFMHFNCPHLNIYWLDNAVIKDLPGRFYMTLDSELDLICRGQDFYIPRDDDDLYMGDLSVPDRNMMNDVYNTAEACAFRIWDNIKFRDTMKFFFRGMRVRINRDIRPLHPQVMEERRIKAEKTFLFNTIMAIDPYKTMELARDRTHAGAVFV